MSYVVYSVESGDRLVLMGPPIVAGQPTLKPIAISYVQAPKLARRNISGFFSPEEPCAYDAAELIRSQFIGKPVRFEEDFYIDALKRSAGRLTLGDTETDAAVLLLKAGLATVPARCPSNMDKEQFELFTQVMQFAEARKRGVFAPDAAKRVRNLENLQPEQLAKIAERYLAVELTMRVERMLSSCSLIVSAEEFGDTQFSVHLTGVTNRDPDCDDYAPASKFFAERFLLNRNVTIRVDGLDSYGNVLGSIVSAKGAFQEELLAKGFVKLNNSTLTMAPRIAEMQQAEADARDGRRGAWKNYVPPEEAKVIVTESGSTTTAVGADAATAVRAAVQGIPTTNADGSPGPAYTGPVNFTGVLTQVVHGDTVVIREDATGQYVRMGLAGVRCSKNIQRDQDGNSPEARVTYNDYAWEAREYLRQHYVGQKVTVKVEYARVMPETKEVRPASTVTMPETGANIGAALLEKGYATFFLGRNDSCSAAEVLRDAEEAAKASFIGLQNTKVVCPPKTVVELGRLGESRGRYYLSFLQRGMQGSRPPALKGVVDIVLGPTSLRVYVPKEHFQIPVRLSGVIAPQTAMSATEKGDLFAEEARDFVVRLIQQRDVTIQVYSSDRGGNFISAVLLEDGTNVSVALVEAGLATIGNADRLPFAQQLADAEATAREAARGIWSAAGGIPQRAAKMEQARAASNPHALARVLDGAKFKGYMLTEVADNGLSVFLQEYGPAIDEAKGRIQDLSNKTVASGEYVPKKGELVVAQYATDKTWCRAKVLSLAKGGQAAEVQYIDFGNVETVKVQDVRYIPKGVEFAIVRDTPPMSFCARLAFLKSTVPSAVYAEAAVEAVYTYTDGEVLAKPMYKDGTGGTYFLVATSDTEPSLGESLLEQGLALLDKRTGTVDPVQYKRHKAAQEAARKGRQCLWEYGDVGGDEDEDDY